LTFSNWQLISHFILQDGEIDQYELQEILSLAFAKCKYGSYPNIPCLEIKFVVVVVVECLKWSIGLAKYS